MHHGQRIAKKSCPDWQPVRSISCEARVRTSISTNEEDDDDFE